jgi:hypothetical protein
VCAVQSEGRREAWPESCAAVEGRVSCQDGRRRRAGIRNRDIAIPVNFRCLVLSIVFGGCLRYAGIASLAS